MNGAVLGPGEAHRLANRALAGWLLVSQAGRVPLDARWVSAEVQERDGFAHVAVTACDGSVLALYQIMQGTGCARLMQMALPAVEAPDVLARSRALRRAISGQVSHGVAVRNRGAALAARSRAARVRSGVLLARSAGLREGAVNQAARSRALRADAYALRARSQAARAKAAAQIQRGLALSTQISTLLTHRRAA